MKRPGIIVPAEPGESKRWVKIVARRRHFQIWLHADRPEKRYKRSLLLIRIFWRKPGMVVQPHRRVWFIPKNAWRWTRS